jgi:outer membrane protein assembly factor BamB
VKHARGLFVTLFALGCAGGQTREMAAFGARWRDDGDESVRAVLSRIAASPVPLGADAVVGVTSSGLVGTSLTDRRIWTHAHAIDSRPFIAGSVVVATGNGEVFALDARTGVRLWARPSAGTLRGAGDDGRTTVVSLTQAGDRASLVLAVEHNGTVVRQIEAAPAVGVPAVLGPLLFLPWSGQYVTVYDTSRGEEVARLAFPERVSRAFAAGGSIFFADLGVFRLSEMLPLASAQKATRIVPLARALPGQPSWFRSGFDAPPVAADAHDTIALFARPMAGGSARVDSNRFALLYDALAVGLEADTGAVAWVHTSQRERIAASAYAGGFALCDTDGKVTLVTASDGTEVSSFSLGRPVTSCVLQTDGLPRPVTARPRRPLLSQIGEALTVTREEVLPIQELLIAETAAKEAPEATGLLVDVLSSPRTPKALRTRAEAALMTRHNGAQYVLRGLDRHYDYLKGVLVPPPIGVFSDALAAMREKRAAGPLASHLLDPANPSADVRKAAAALLRLGGPEQLGDLETFFSFYRTSADDDDLTSAVLDVARALLAWGGDEAHSLVARASRDPFTTEPVRRGLAALFPPSAAPSE